MDLLLILIILIVPIYAQIKVNSSYRKYSEVNNSMNMTGKDVARMILDKNGLSNVSIGEIRGELTDHYNPTSKHINLSTNIYSDTSISSIAVAAHECGHAIQDKENYGFLRFRTAMVPVVNFTSRFATIFVFIGFLLEAVKLVDIGILFLLVGLFFQLITLPVEFDASKRAAKFLEKEALVEKKEQEGSKKMLTAAAMTYVASVLTVLLQIFRLVLIATGDNDRR